MKVEEVGGKAGKKMTVAELEKKLETCKREYEMAKTELEEATKATETLGQKLHRVTGVGQLVAEVLSRMGPSRFHVRASNGTRYVVGVRSGLANSTRLVTGSRVTLDIVTFVIMRILPREVDPLVHRMTKEVEDPGNVSYDQIGGLESQIRILREVVELPLRNPEIFKRVGIRPPKGILLYGHPGTGKTLLARAVASQLDCNFLKVVGSSIVDKYIGESARVIREMFAYANQKAPCIIFIDEVDAIAARRFENGNAADREIQRTLLELLAQMDGFNPMGQVKVVMATNRPDTLDPALLRPGRLDRKLEVPLPNETARRDILRIHARPVRMEPDADLDTLAALSDTLSAADLRNVVTEAGLLALRSGTTSVSHHNLLAALRKVRTSKGLESQLNYTPV